MPNRKANPPASDPPPDGASSVAFNLLKSRLDSEYQLRQLAEAAVATARNALIELGQDLFGDFKEVHKQLPAMSEPEIANLIYQRVQQKIAEQVAFAVKQAAASKTTPPPAPVIAVCEAPARLPPASTAPVTPAPPPEPPAADWAPVPPVSVVDQPAVMMKTAPAAAAPDADEEVEDTGVVLELVDFVPYTPDFTPVAPAATWPAWFSDWMSQQGNADFPKEFTILQILGRTGEPYRSVVTTTAARLLNLQSGRSGSIGRPIEHLIELGWMIREEARWRTTLHLLALTGQGQDVYRQLFGAEPAPQTLALMLARHSSTQHVYLILEAQRILEASGYAVERYPAGNETPDGMTYPDLVAEFEGRTLYIEAETTSSKSKSSPDRHAKWARYRDLTHGQFYLVTADRTGSRALLSELRHWAQTTHQTFEAYVLEISSGPGAGWSVWQHSTIGG